MREVIVHYHLFKNAGTSVDYFLQQTFGDGWIQIDSADPRGRIMPEELRAILEGDPGIQAISSHQAILPPPELSGARVAPILLLRHPLDRARSVYWFERKQQTGSPGREFAASHSFADYIRWRLDQSSNGVIHNFQTMFLLQRPGRLQPRVDETTFGEAEDALWRLEFFGIVESFQETMSHFCRKFPGNLQGNNITNTHKNQNRDSGETLQERLARMKQNIGKELYYELEERNRFDFKLYRKADYWLNNRRKSLEF